MIPNPHGKGRKPVWEYPQGKTHRQRGQQKAELEKLVCRIVKARCESADVSALEAEVNERVYRLFGLTREEIAIVEAAR